MKKHSPPVSLIVLLIASLACAQPGGAPAPAQDPNAANTSVAQEIARRQTQAAAQFTPTFTSSPETPSATPTQNATSTPEVTNTPEQAMLSVSVDTNCRVGPGAIYERAGILLTGETVEVIGRDPKNEYWYVRNPDNNPQYCWVWGEYATVTGNVFALVYMTPPPVPSTTFSAVADKLQNCALWWVDFKLTNNSGAVFRSVSITLTDPDANPAATVVMTSNDFIHNDGCASPQSTDVLSAESTVTVSSGLLSKDPKGHNLTAKIVLCMEVNQGGTCLTQEVKFKP